jgi:predicted ATPase/transcriptional regulator with XRE-family HTH domain
MDVIYSFGEWVRRRRKALDMTQDDLADCVGCSPIMIRKIESDERRPSEQITLRLADCFNMPAAERPMLLRVARGEQAVDHLAVPGAADSPGIARISQQVRALPGQLTPFVGRSVELRRITERLTRSECRLLTLIGPGGIGKTRLAIQTAHKITGFADGIFYISLAPLLSAEYLPLAIAQALEVSIPGSADPQAQLISQLAAREVLLVLDNFEHLLDGASLVGEILEAAPRVRMLVTSREQLDLHGEWLVPITGMALPQNGEGSDYNRYDAVQLFMETAQRVDPDFALDDHWRDVVHICRMVEGNPLGIELAAAQLLVLPCSEIAQRLQHSLDVLASSFRNVPERHRSMRALFEHSWNMLTDDQQTVLARLSVFRGGFMLEAAGQVAGAEGIVLAALVEKSLVRVDGEGRYSLHELLRQYAAEKLTADPALQAATEQAHSACFADFLFEREEALRASTVQSAMQEIDAERQNVHAAWQHALAHRLTRDLEKSVNTFQHYCIARAYFHEGQLAYQGIVSKFEALADHDEAAQRMLTLALSRLAHFQFAGGDVSQARGMVERSLSMAHALGWREEEALALGIMGLCAYSVEEAIRLFEQALELRRAYQYKAGISDVCQNLGLAAAGQGRYEDAAQYFHEALTIAEESGDAWGSNVCLYYLGRIATLTGDIPEAARCLSEALAICKRHDFRLGIVENGVEIGMLSVWKLGDYATAIPLLRDSLDLFREFGPRPWRTTNILIYLGTASCAMGAPAEAHAYLHEALGIAHNMPSGRRITIVEVLVHLGLLFAHTGQTNEALNLLHTATRAVESGDLTEREAHPVALQEIRIRIEEVMASLRLSDALVTLRTTLEAQMGAQVVAAALAKGDAPSPDEIAAALLAG